MAGETEVCNFALGLLATSRIEDFETEDSIEAERCRDILPTVRKRFLREANWRFATKHSVALSQLSSITSQIYEYRYQLPGDIIKIIRVYGEAGLKIDFEKVQDTIFCDIDGVYIDYIYDETDLSKFPSDSSEAFSYDLAKSLSTSIDGLDSRYVRLKDDAEEAKTRARANDANDGNDDSYADLRADESFLDAWTN